MRRISSMFLYNRPNAHTDGLHTALYKKWDAQTAHPIVIHNIITRRTVYHHPNTAASKPLPLPQPDSPVESKTRTTLPHRA